MSATQRVTSTTFGPAATARSATAGRNVASVAFPRVVEMGGSNATGAQEQSVRYDDGYRPPEERGRRNPRAAAKPRDFFSYAEVSFLDEVLAASDWNTVQIILPSAVLAGVRRYDANNLIIGGLVGVGGETYDRLH